MMRSIFMDILKEWRVMSMGRRYNPVFKEWCEQVFLHPSPRRISRELGGIFSMISLMEITHKLSNDAPPLQEPRRNYQIHPTPSVTAFRPHISQYWSVAMSMPSDDHSGAGNCSVRGDMRVITWCMIGGRNSGWWHMVARIESILMSSAKRPQGGNIWAKWEATQGAKRRNWSKSIENHPEEWA